MLLIFSLLDFWTEKVMSELNWCQQTDWLFNFPGHRFCLKLKTNASCIFFCTETADRQGPLLVRRFLDFTNQLQTEEGQNVYSECSIYFPFPVKPEFQEEILKFDRSNFSTLFILSFQAFDQNIGVLRNITWSEILNRKLFYSLPIKF